MWNIVVIAEVIFTSIICASILLLPYLTRLRGKRAEIAKSE